MFVDIRYIDDVVENCYNVYTLDINKIVALEKRKYIKNTINYFVYLNEKIVFRINEDDYNMLRELISKEE